MKRSTSLIVTLALDLCGTAQAVPIVVDYGIASTGQTARASFEFFGGSTLTGGDAILTSLSFALPRVKDKG